MTSPAAMRAAHRIYLELENRVAMLSVHGAILIVIGILMILTGAPAPAEGWFGPSARLVLGTAGVLAGSTLMIGVARGDDDTAGWVMMTMGTAAAALWHVGLTATYAYAAVVEEMVLLSPGETLGEEITSRGYIPFVYLGYVLLILIHHVTLLRLGPPPR